MLSVLAVLGITATYGSSVNFYPEVIEGPDYHTERIWGWLHPKCFTTDASVREFKDFLLSEYDCISWDAPERREIYQHPTGDERADHWSLWLEIEGNAECLRRNVTLPNNMISECVGGVFWEPLFHVAQSGGCTTQTDLVNGNLWSLDIMDGVLDNAYRFYRFTQPQADVEAIVLDTGVDSNHVEFATRTVVELGGNPSGMTYQHGTHVSGTVMGNLVGGAKDTNLNWYPVCRQGTSCSWSHIQGGYNTAIALMRNNPNKKYVINFSVGGGRSSSGDAQYNTWGSAISDLGSLWAVAAGNSRANACNSSPSFSTWAITVGAYQRNRTPSPFTNFGSCVDIFGPGSNVWSSNPGDGYGYSSGTSMSSPGICALLINILKYNGAVSLAQAKAYLIENSWNVLNAPSSWGPSRAGYWHQCPAV